MNRFVTIRRSDPEFDRYITGTFSKTERAIPMGSLNIRSQSRFVTFKIVPQQWDKKPGRARVIWGGLRPRLLTITATPIILTLLLLTRTGQPVNWMLAILSALALMFLHLSVFLLNDFFDHYKGRDQINRSKGSRIIQRGWATARAVRFWGIFNLVVGISLGLPAVIQKPLVVGGIGVLAVLIILGYSNLKKGLRETGVGEILVSLSLGPLLVTGYSLTVSGRLSLEVLLVGLIFGWMSSLIFQLKNIEEMVTTYQNRSSSLIQRLGFDKGRKFIQWQLLLLPVTALLLFQCLPSKVVMSFCVIPLFLTCYWMERKIRHADSPMSSVLTGVSDEMAMIHLKNAVFFVVILFPPFV